MSRLMYKFCSSVLSPKLSGAAINSLGSCRYAGRGLIQPRLMFGILSSSHYSANHQSNPVDYEDKTKLIKFDTNENDFFRTLCKIDSKQSRSLPLPQALRKLIEVHSNNDPKAHEDYSFLVDDLSRVSQKLSSPELNQFLNELAKLRKANSLHVLNFRPYRQMYTSVDYLFTDKLKNRSNIESEALTELLDTCLLWSDIGLARVTNFCHLMSRLCFTSLKKLDDQSFMKFLLLLNHLRKPLDVENHEKLENELILRVPKMSQDEVGLVCASFFKTQTRVRKVELVKQIISKFDEGTAECDEVALTSVIKCLRFSKSYSNEGPKLARDFISRISNDCGHLGIKVLVHLCRLSAYYLHFSENLLSTSLEKLLVAENIRLKDCERIIRTCSEFNYEISDELMGKLIDVVRKVSDHGYNHPNSFLSAVNAFSAYDVFPEDFIKLALSADFHKALTKTSTTHQENAYGAVFMYTIVSLKAPQLMKHDEWPAEYLNSAIANLDRLQLNDIMSKTKKAKTSYEIIFRKLFLAVRQLYGSQVVVNHTLPFAYHPDILVNLQPNVPAKPIQNFTFAPDSVRDSTVVMLNGLGQYSDPLSTRLNKFAKQRIELLETLGYKVVVVPWYEIVDYDVMKIARKMSVKIDTPVKS
ncbi:hypothetical protein HDE_02664 [Halotydeus destructor]|nr:hypothetical protein HDE_02664 [Halotydeus destructor]